MTGEAVPKNRVVGVETSLPMLELQLGDAPQSTLSSALDAYFGEEEVPDVKDCPRTHRAVKVTRVTKAPPLIIIHIKRHVHIVGELCEKHLGPFEWPVTFVMAWHIGGIRD